MSIYEFDAEREWALIRRDERILAKEELRDEVTQQVREEITKQVTEDVTRQVTEDVTRQVTEQIQKAEQRIASSYKLLINVLQSQQKDKSAIIDLLQTETSLSNEEAIKQVELYWQD